MNILEERNSIFLVSKSFLFRKFVLFIFLSLFCASFWFSLFSLLRNGDWYNGFGTYGMVREMESTGDSVSESFGNDNYRCVGTCFCDEQRRFGVARISKQVFGFIAAVSSLVAYNVATRQFDDECVDLLYDECLVHSIQSEVEECFVESPSSDLEGESSRILCKGSCRAKSFDIPHLIEAANQFNCGELNYEDYVEIVQIDVANSIKESPESIFKNNFMDGFCEAESIMYIPLDDRDTPVCITDERNIECFPTLEQGKGFSSTSIIQNVRGKFKKIADPERAKNTAKYFKGVGTFHGVLAKDLREKVFKPVYDTDIKTLPIQERLDVACKLIESTNLDEKKVGILILKKNIKLIYEEGSEFVDAFLDRMELMIDGFVYDWGTADALAGFVFDGLLRVSEGEYKSRFEEWKDSQDLFNNGENSNWRQRIACVSFVKLARFGEFNDEIIEICETCVRNDFRFTQLGVGWVLRELSLNDLDRVVDFIKVNYRYFSREGLRYAIEKMDKDLRKELLAFGKNQRN